MRNWITGCAVLVAGAFALVAGSRASADTNSQAGVDRYLDLEPADTLSGQGYGYDSIARTFVSRQCVEFKGGLIDGGGGAGGDSFSYHRVTSNYQLADSMDLSIRTRFSASMGVASGSSDSKLGLFESTKTNTLTQTIVASYKKVEPFKYISGEIRLKPEYAKLAGKPAFREQCGDYFIVGVQEGRWMYGVVQLVVDDVETASKLGLSSKVGASYVGQSASASLKSLNELKNTSHKNDLKVDVISSGTKRASVTIDQFLKQVESFPGAKGSKATFKLKAIPYEDVVVNWPSKDPLAPMTSDEKLGKLVEAAYGLEALSEDTRFVKDNKALFALGTEPAKRKERLEYYESRLGDYRDELADLRKKAQNCDVDWKPKCEELFKKWRDFAEFANPEYRHLPVRYGADCRTSRIVTPSLLNKSGKEVYYWFSDNPRGDKEMGGGPVAVSAYLNLAPHFTGGDRLAVRTLLATLNITLEENKDDHSTFKRKVEGDVVDLDTLDPSTDLSECAFRGNGTKLQSIRLDSAQCSLMKQISPGSKVAEEVCETKVESKYEGILHQLSAKDPRNDVTFNKNAKGALKSISCTVDTPDSDDLKNVRCGEISFEPVELDLVDKNDVVADKWDPPAKRRK
jgi:hypothetical protein